MPHGPGTTLAHYTLVERIGEGGMGEVWRAHDSHLDRDVAVKLLAPGAVGDGAARERFRREAHVLSRLSHPGIATIFDFDTKDGTDFLVLEYVAGGSLQARLLRGPLDLDDVVRLGANIADAVEDAHRLGFLHRDLKPGNVVLTAAGHPKVLDFGLAGLLQHGRTMASPTRAGTVVGSLPYMAPEQLVGDADDVRTDVYALGALLFEMATGRRPFSRERTEALMFEILNSAPPPARSLRPDLPLGLDRLVAACLAKDPALRPASAGLVAQALRAIGTGAPAVTLPAPRDVVRSMAVLPLHNVSRDPAQDYFADGMTEALISDLARIKALRVISRTSAMKYKGTQKTLPEVARELNVDAVLEGSALLVGSRVRVTVRLVSAATDDTLWADRYDRDLEDVLALQGDVAETVAREIAIQLTPSEAGHLARRAAVRPEAHIEYLKGRHAFFAASPHAVALGMRHLRRALDEDPAFAPAWSGLADCHAWGAIRGMFPPAAALREAAAAASRAIELDPSLAEAHLSLGIVRAHTGEIAAGLRSLQQAVDLNPGLAMAHKDLGRVLYSYERHHEALAAMSAAVRLDPLSMLIRTGAGDAHYFAREYEKSVLHYRMAIELDPRFDGAHTDLARSLEALGRFEEARAAYEQGRRLSGGVAGPTFGLAHLAVSMGHEAEARRVLAELTAARATRVVSAWGIAAVHASLGDADEAFRWLETAVAEHASGLILLRVHPRLDPIRPDPRYGPLVARLGLAD